MQFYNSNNQKTLTLTRRNSSPYLKPDMILPDNCHTISSETFFKRSIIRSVIFPYEMQQIGAKAFQGCSRLNSLEFPGNLQKIGIGAFSDCPSLEQVQIPAGLATIPKNAFRNGLRLKKLEFAPDSHLAPSKQMPFQNVLLLQKSLFLLLCRKSMTELL